MLERLRAKSGVRTSLARGTSPSASYAGTAGSLGGGGNGGTISYGGGGGYYGGGGGAGSQTSSYGAGGGGGRTSYVDPTFVVSGSTPQLTFGGQNGNGQVAIRF